MPTRRPLLLLAALVLLVTGLAAIPSTLAGVATGWYRAEFGDRIGSGDRALLDARSTHVLPAGGNAYVVWGHPGAVAGASVAPVREKIHPAARTTTHRLVLAHPDGAADLTALLGAQADITGQGLASFLVAELPLAVDDVAAHPAVLHVGPAPTGLEPEDEASAQIVAGNSRLDDAPAGYADFLADHGVTGDGVRVAIVDTGVDRNHPDVADRVFEHLDYTTAAGEPHDTYGHGTHVAGIVGGNGTSGGLNVTDAEGRLYGLGVAPQVQLLDQNAIALSAPQWPPAYGFETLTSDALVRDTRIWNASWTTGEGTAVGYIGSAATLDGLVRDGDADQPGNQPFTMVFSAGNSGPDLNTLTAPKEAKNLIVVAASNNVRTLTGGSASGEEIAGFSSRGPAMDGRVIPQVAAPGANIVSTRALPTAYACNLPPQDAGASLYSFCSGTSMAAPHVTGSVALLTEWWRNQGNGDPSPALSKALLVNTAEDMFAQDVPNPHEGWGRVNLGNLFDPSAMRVINDQATTLTELDATHERQVGVADPDRPLRITLAWTDAPGVPVTEPTEPALVNDLDLEVVAPNGTTVYRGNVFADGASVAGGDHDRIDNLENVFIPTPQVGTYTVHVTAHNLPGDGVPDVGDSTDQDFALVISNGAPADGGPAVRLPDDPTPGGDGGTGDDTTGVTADSIVLGMHAGVTGASPLPTTSYQNSRDLYWRYVTEDRGHDVLGRSSVDVLFRDDRHTPDGARQVCRELAGQALAVHALRGIDQLLACGQLAEQGEFPYLTGGTAEAGLTDNPWYFAQSATNRHAAYMLAHLVARNPHGDAQMADGKIAAIVANTSAYDDAVAGWHDGLQETGSMDRYYQTYRHPKGDPSWYGQVAQDFQANGVSTVFFLGSPIDLIDLSQWADISYGYNPRYVGVDFGLNAILGSGCGSPGTRLDDALSLSAAPGLDWARVNTPEFFDVASDHEVPADDVAFHLWGQSAQLHMLFDRYEDDHGTDAVTRSGLRASIEQQTDVRSGIFPSVSFSPDDHFGADEVHVLRADCGKQEFTTVDTFVSGF